MPWPPSHAEQFSRPVGGGFERIPFGRGQIFESAGFGHFYHGHFLREAPAGIHRTAQGILDTGLPVLSLKGWQQHVQGAVTAIGQRKFHYFPIGMTGAEDFSYH